MCSCLGPSVCGIDSIFPILNRIKHLLKIMMVIMKMIMTIGFHWVCFYSTAL